MTKHISIFVDAAPEFDELLDIFRRMLSDPFVFKLQAAASKYKEECQERAIAAADARTIKLSAELLKLEPLLEEYRHAIKHPHTGGGPNMCLRGIIKKIVELYGQATVTNKPPYQ